MSKSKKTKGAKKAASAVAAPPKLKKLPKEKAPAAGPRDPRLPAVGSTMLRPYKGKEYRVEVLEHGFRYDGREFRSLSALAAEITGAKSINGFFWFNLTTKRAPAAKGPTVRDGSAKEAS